MLKEDYHHVTQNSCLRGGVSVSGCTCSLGAPALHFCSSLDQPFTPTSHLHTQLSKLWEVGNGMRNKFATPAARLSLLSSGQDKPAIGATLEAPYDIGASNPETLLQQERPWDFVILNDYTQAPARDASRNETSACLRENYVPLFFRPGPAGNGESTRTTSTCTTTVVFLETFAYKVPNMRGTQDLGDFEEFSEKLRKGYEHYQTVVLGEEKDEQGHGKWKELVVREDRKCLVAPVGQAFVLLYRTNRSLWKKLYSWDDFHPSPHGTWLQACVLYCTMTEHDPPHYNAAWWDSCRRMQPPDQAALPLPTEQEAEQLRQAAMSVVRDGKKTQKANL